MCGNRTAFARKKEYGDGGIVGEEWLGESSKRKADVGGAENHGN
jgi:hypothetical protein